MNEEEDWQRKAGDWKFLYLIQRDMANIYKGMAHFLLDYMLNAKKEDSMDKKIRKIEKESKKVEKDLKSLEKADKKRDKFVNAGKKMMKKK